MQSHFPIFRLCRRKLALTLPLLLLAAACHRGDDGNGKPPAGIPVIAGDAERRDVAIRVEAVGNVEAITSVAIKSRIDGQIMKLGFKDGADVARGQVLFEIDPRPARAQLKQAEAKLASDQAQLVRAREQDVRYQDLLKKHFVSPDAYTQIKANLDSARASVDASQAAADNARLMLEYATLRAPIAGRAGRIQVQAGNLVKANDTPPLVTLNQITPIYVNFSVPEKYLPAVRAAMQAGSRVEIRGSDSGAPIKAEGKLSFVDNAVDAATGTIRLRATVENRDAGLWPGQFVTVSVTLGTERNAVTVPADAVQSGPDGNYVYVIDADAHARLTPVKVSRTLDGQSVVAEGLKGGERIVVDGQSRLLPGAAVTIQKPGN